MALHRAPKEGVNEKASKNLVIEGENLEVLRLLQKSYRGRIKMIYIDPPYNTGNDFVYDDKFAESPLEYEKRSGLRAEDGSALQSNRKSSGRYHSNWLSMMYPRLVLARELLAEDGVIFVSIDDNEVANLDSLLREVFGEENGIGIFTWVRKKKGSFLSNKARKMTEYVVLYEKEDYGNSYYGEDAYTDKWQPIVKRTNNESHLSIPAGIVTTTLEDGQYKKGFYGSEGTGIEYNSTFIVKNGIVISELNVTGHFVWSQSFFDTELEKGTKISLSKKFGFNVLRFDQDEKTKTPSTLINNENEVGTNEDATEELHYLFGTSKGL
jgi:adenine-specific DNA-methyltransferase